MRVFNCLSGSILCGLTLLLIFLPCFTPEWAGNFILISLSAIPICIADGIIFAILLWRHNRWWMLYLFLLLGSLPVLACQFPFFHSCTKKKCWIQSAEIGLLEYQRFRLNKDTLTKAAHSIRVLQDQASSVCKNVLIPIFWHGTPFGLLFLIIPIASSTRGKMKSLIWPSSAAGLSETFKSTTFPNSYNKILQADIQMTGRTFRLFNVHLQTTGMNESYSMKDRFRRCATTPSSVTGKPIS